jgi:hypothetical protein
MLLRDDPDLLAERRPPIQRATLGGYADYMRKVRHRLMPGVW